MTQRLVILALALWLVACGSAWAHPGPARAIAASARCGPRSAQTLSASRAARVYVLGRAVYGCSIHGSQSYRLGQRATCIGSTRVGPAIVADELAAYGLERCGIDAGSTQVVVRRLTDGKQLRSIAATSPTGPESFQSVDSIALKSDGAVAWIGVANSIVSHGKKIEVHKADKRGEVELDSGAVISAGSLRLHHSELTWTHGNSTRHATLS